MNNKETNKNKEATTAPKLITNIQKKAQQTKHPTTQK